MKTLLIVCLLILAIVPIVSASGEPVPTPAPCIGENTTPLHVHVVCDWMWGDAICVATLNDDPLHYPDDDGWYLCYIPATIGP